MTPSPLGRKLGKDGWMTAYLSINLLMTKIKNCDCEAGTETVKRDTKNRNCACTVVIRVRRWLVFLVTLFASLALSEEEPLQHTTYL